MHVNERPFGHAPGHARHDRLLVTRFAGGDAAANEAADARRLIEQCTDCARLADDMRLLRSAIAQLPTPPRTRNFRLTEAQAEALHGNALERLLRRLVAPGLTMLRPVAGVALAMGLTVAVIGAGLPSTSPEAATDAGQPTLMAGNQSPQTAQATPQPPAAAGASSGGKEGETFGLESAPSDRAPDEPSGTGGITSVAVPSDEPRATANDIAVPPSPTREALVVPPNAPTPPASADTRVLLIYGGVTLAMFAFAILLLAWYARRRLEDPLLR